MKTQRQVITILTVLCCLIFYPQVSTATSLTLYDDFNDNKIDPSKWLVEPLENAGAITEANGTLHFYEEFNQGQKVQVILLGPDKAFNALEAKIKLSSATELVQSFGISLCLWNDGIFDYSARISFIRYFTADSLSITGSIRKSLGENNFYSVPIPKEYPPFEQLISPGTLCSKASTDTWYRIRIAYDGKQVSFYAKEGDGVLQEEDIKAIYTVEGAVEPPLLSSLCLFGASLSSVLEGFFDDIAVGMSAHAYSISGIVAGASDNTTVGLYAGTFPLEIRNVQQDGSYTFRFLRDQKTYTVRSPDICSLFEPQQRTVTIQGENQKDVNFTVAADNASIEALYAIQGGRLIDGNGGETVDDSLILVKGNRIQSVSKASETAIPEGYQVIDAHGKTIIPGLFDMHVHFWREATPSLAMYNAFIMSEPIGVEYQKNLYAFLFCGVTSVLDLGSDENLVLNLRKKEQEGCMVSPRIYSAGSGIMERSGSQSTFHIPARYAGTPEEAQKVVGPYVQKKPDVAKIFYAPSSAEVDYTLKTLIDELRKRGVKSAVHAIMNWHSKKVVPLAPDALAHIPNFPDDELINGIIENKVAVISTLNLQHRNFAFLENPGFIDEPLLKSCVDPRLRSTYKDPSFISEVNNIFGWVHFTHALWKTSAPDLYKKLRKLYDAGIPLMMGTDAGSATNFQGVSAHDEISYLVEAGFTPLQAITMATKNGPMFLGKQDQQGTIEAGKLADLVILKADPSKDISNTKKIALVMKDGQIMDRGMLSRDITGRLCEEARYIADRIDLMPASAFKDGGSANKATLAGKMEEIYTLLNKADENETGLDGYTQASQMLSANIMPLIDGCATGCTGDDLITNCAYQKGIYVTVQQLIEDCLKK